MPTSSIHAIVAKKITDKYKSLNNYDFFLGSVAPDSVNLYGFAEKEERWEAHLRDKDLDKWTNNIVEFYNAEKDNINTDFLKGYVTHVITDIVYDRTYYMEVRNEIEELGIEQEKAHTFMQTEMKIFGAKNKDYLYVKEVLESKELGYNIRNIESDQMVAWKNKIINEKIKDMDATVFKQDIVDNLFNDTLKVLEDNKVL